MTSDEINMWRLACVLVFIMALSALVVGSLAFTRTNNANNPNNIFLGSTSLTDFAATQTVKTRNILGSTLAPAITTAGTLFNGDLNANSLSFTGQGITLYSDTTQLYFVLDSAPDSKQFLSTSVESFNLTGVVTSTGLQTSIPDGNITNSMLANVALGNISGTAFTTFVNGTFFESKANVNQFTGPTTINGGLILASTLNVAGATTAAAIGATSLTVSGAATTGALTASVVNSSTNIVATSGQVSGLSVRTLSAYEVKNNVNEKFAGTGTLIGGTVGTPIVISGLTTSHIVMLTHIAGSSPAIGALSAQVATNLLTVFSLAPNGTSLATDVSSFSYIAFLVV
jgi:hypothetical protein